MGKTKNSKIYKSYSFYHIYNRGNRKNLIFNKEKDYEVFRNQLYKYLKKTHIRLIAYCFMPNHYHFIFKCGKRWKEIPILMQKFMTAYSMYYNRSYLKVGRLCQSPFQVKILLTKKDLAREIDYLKNNPKKIKTKEPDSKYKWLYIKQMN